MADTRPETDRHPNWASRRENRASTTQRHPRELDPVVPGNQRVPLGTASFWSALLSRTI